MNMGSHRANVVMTSIMMQLALGTRQGSKPEGGNAAFGFVEKGWWFRLRERKADAVRIGRKQV